MRLNIQHSAFSIQHSAFSIQHSPSKLNNISDQRFAAPAIDSSAGLFSHFVHRIRAIFHRIDHSLQRDILASADRCQNPGQIFFASLALVADARQFRDFICCARPCAHCFSDLRIANLIRGANNFVFSHDSPILMFLSNCDAKRFSRFSAPDRFIQYNHHSYISKTPLPEKERVRSLVSH
jgi:hypothetical protein